MRYRLAPRAPILLRPPRGCPCRRQCGFADQSQSIPTRNAVGDRGSSCLRHCPKISLDCPTMRAANVLMFPLAEHLLLHLANSQSPSALARHQRRSRSPPRTPVTPLSGSAVQCTSPVRRKSLHQVVQIAPLTLRQKMGNHAMQHRPRQITGCRQGFSGPIEIFHALRVHGIIRCSGVAIGSCVEPEMIGTFGPYTSGVQQRPCGPSCQRQVPGSPPPVVFPTAPFPWHGHQVFHTWYSLLGGAGCCPGIGPGGMCPLCFRTQA